MVVVSHTLLMIENSVNIAHRYIARGVVFMITILVGNVLHALHQLYWNGNVCTVASYIAHIILLHTCVATYVSPARVFL